MLVLTFCVSGCTIRQMETEGAITCKRFEPAHEKVVTVIEYQKASGYNMDATYLPVYRDMLVYNPDTYCIYYGRQGEISVNRELFGKLREGQYIYLKKGRSGYDVFVR
jgi:hypothetical protein